MKKYLIFLIIFFSLFLAPKVSAAGYDFKMNSNDYYNYMLASDDYIKSFPYINQNVFNNFESALENRLDSSIYDYVILYTAWRGRSSSAEYSFHVLYFDKGQNVDFFLDTMYETSYSSYWTLDFRIKTFSNVNYGILQYNLRDNSNYTLTNETSYRNGTINYFVGRFYRSSSGGIFGIDDYSQGRDMDYGLYKTTIPLKYSSEDSNKPITNLTVYDNSNNNEAYVLNRSTDYGKTFLNTDMKLDFLIPPAPNFNFQITDNYDSFNHKISVDINMTIANYNDDYIYQYQKGGHDDNNWTSLAIEENNGTYYFNWTNWKENTDIYFRVMNPSTHEMVSSATLQISDITNFIELNISNYNGNFYCNGAVGGNSPLNNKKGIVLIPKTTNVEQQSTIYFSVPSDFTLPSDEYKFGYSLKSQNLSSTQYFDIQTLFNQNASNFNFNNNATFTDFFSRDNYNIYYIEPLEIRYTDDQVVCFDSYKPLIISFDNNLYEYQIINSDNTINSIIDPNNGNTYILDSILPNGSNNNQNFLNQVESTFNNNSDKLKEIFGSMWNSFKNLSGIGSYLFIVIGFSITLWIIKAFKK